MAPEAIPIAPDTGSGSADAFDEDILAEIERRLESEDGAPPTEESAAQKVELDKADLPLDYELEPEEEESAPAVEVDLAEEALSAEPADEAPPEEQETKKGSRLLPIAGGLIMVLAMGAGSYWYFKPAPPKKPEQKAAELKPYQFRGPVPDFRKVLHHKFKPFIVPLGKSEQGLILRVVVSLEANDPEDKLLLEEHNRMMRDVIYRLLRGRLATGMKSARGKKLLQAQIKTELNHALKGSIIHQVYFTDFVITG